MKDVEARRREIEAQLVAVRERTLCVLDVVPDAVLPRRVHEFYSPIGWHFGHIGRTEVFWTAETALGRSPENSAFDLLFTNVPENPKENRVNLPDRAGIVAYLADTRARSLAALRDFDLSSSHPLLADGYAFEFAVRHEYQHQETIAELMQLIQKAQLPTTASEINRFYVPTVAETPMVALPGGSFQMGSADPHGYDNEKMPHLICIDPFLLDEMPVTNGQWLGFVAAGGYESPDCWSEAGWAWRTENAVTFPEYWHPVSNAFRAIGAHGLRTLDLLEPVCGISWYEADAYARWSGKRLPTEAEWEYAAGCSALGLHDRGGRVWEWTASLFLPYPGFVAFPYDGYSLTSMDGKHFVCRGGSWATGTPNLRAAFRNFYVPSYRQGFLGVRCAR